MGYDDFCIPDNLGWETDLYSVYHFKDANEQEKSLFYFRIPMEPRKEMIYLEKYGLQPDERQQFYENLVACISRQTKVSQYLADRSIQGVLNFTKVENFQDAEGVFHIYLETELIVRLLYKMFCDSFW